MKRIKIRTIALITTLLCSAIVQAQEKNDYYKFDDKGILAEFRLTLPDGVYIQFDQGDSDAYTPKLAVIVYPDGTTVDFRGSCGKGFDNWYIKTAGNPVIKDWYKELRKETSAPLGSEMMNIFGLSDRVILFPDNSQVRIYGNWIQEYVDIKENGDCISIDRLGDIKFLNLHNPAIKAVKGQQPMSAKIAIRKTVDDEETGEVLMEDGSTFTGSFTVALNDEERSYRPKSLYLNALFGDKVNKEDQSCPKYGFDNITGIYLRDGIVVDKQNKVIAMYKDYTQLDEFDMASELAVIQGELDKEKAAAKKRAGERTAITTKYGSKFANAFFAGKLSVGMPWSLVEIGLDAHSFNDFYSALLSFERQSEYGSRKCYTLIGEDLTNVGHMWVQNGKVQSITFY